MLPVFSQRRLTSMKRNHLLSVLMISTLALSTAANAEHHHGDSSPKERVGALANFAIMGVMSAVIHKGSQTAGLSGASTSILHTANVLYNLGQIADKPVLKDLGLRALVAGASAKVASADAMQKDLLPHVPFIGESLAKSGSMGVGVVTVS